MTAERVYQRDFSSILPEAMYNTRARSQKARKIIAIISDVAGSRLDDLTCLDVGCSTGIIDNLLADHFKLVCGIDIDGAAVHHAVTHKLANEFFMLGDCPGHSFC